MNLIDKFGVRIIDVDYVYRICVSETSLGCLLLKQRGDIVFGNECTFLIQLKQLNFTKSTKRNIEYVWKIATAAFFKNEKCQ